MREFGKIVVAFLIAFLLSTIPVFAGSSPTLSSPENNSKLQDSPKLIWLYSGNCPADSRVSCFKVDIDDNSSFDSINKYSYTSNLNYSPQGLSEGKWYWRVKAKDESENWSSYSDIWSFELSPSNASSTPQSSSIPQPTSASSSNNSSSNKTTFEVSSIPASLNSDNSFQAKVQLINLSANSQYFLKGAFVKSGSSNYFGKTRTLGNWVKNNESYSKQFSLNTDSSGNWSGNLEVMPDSDDSGFSGSGSYIFKVARYNSSGSSGPTWSNETTLNLNFIELQAESKKSTSQKTSILSPTPKSSTKPEPTTKPLKLSESAIQTNLASIAGVATQPGLTTQTSTPSSDKTKIASSSQFNFTLIGLGVLVLLVALGYLVYMIKKR